MVSGCIGIIDYIKSGIIYISHPEPGPEGIVPGDRFRAGERACDRACVDPVTTR